MKSPFGIYHLDCAPNDSVEPPEPELPKEVGQKVTCWTDCRCEKCGGTIPEGTDGVWVRGKGLYHPKCNPFAGNGSDPRTEARR